MLEPGGLGNGRKRKHHKSTRTCSKSLPKQNTMAGKRSMLYRGLYISLIGDNILAECC